MDEGNPSIAGGILWALRSLSDITFRWIPGTVQVMSGTAPDTGTPSPVLTPITQPVSISDVNNFLQSAAVPGAYDQLFHNWSIFIAVSVLVSLFLAIGTVYCTIRIFQLRRNEEERFKAAAHSVAAKDVSKSQLRWGRILEQISSETDRDWRLAILEADIMLNELLDVLGYKGETMADKMKQVVRGDFKTIDQAWEAHRVRNQIAHSGSLQQLNPRDAKRVIGMYEQIFREFRFIE